MENPVLYIIVVLVIGAVSFFVARMLALKSISHKLDDAESQSKRLIEQGEKDAEIKKKEAILEAREEWMKVKVDFEKEIESRRREIESSEKRTGDKEADVSKRLEFLDLRENELSGRETTIQGKEKGLEIRQEELEKIISQQNERLQKIAQMTPEEAKKQLMENMVSAAKMEAASHIKEIKERAEKDAEKEAKEIILGSIYRCAADHTAETTVSVVNLPSEEMKGRIIGREGRNIRSFETLTGIDVIVDDTPEAVILSGYDPIRREIARIALEKLVSDGRIHPTRIEEVVEKSKQEMEVKVREAGEQACFELSIHGLHEEIVHQLGKLHFRTSYGQNVLAHSKEVSMICGLMAAELGLDAVMAKRCGLLHDLGKAIDRETEGTHTQIGAEYLRRYKEHEFVSNAAESHHDDVPMISPYPVLVQAADAISGSRPGARREPLEAYIKRLKQLEELADSFKGVAKAYAIQAGREIRVIVENHELDDLAAEILASDIAEKIEGEMQYPGQIKVTVIRETRATEYAR